MPLSPQRIRDAQFKSSRRGYDQAEVDTFLEEAAAALEAAQNEATAMEARARAAVARLQELSQQAPAEPEQPTVRASVDEAETISRTMLLAQRTADSTIADAQAEADRVLAAARDEATAHLDSARQDAARLIEETKVEARRAGEAERVRVEGEVQALLARRDFLESDVDHLEQHVQAQRERIVEVVAQLNDLVQRVPAGLADLRRPLLSAAENDDVTGDSSDERTDDTTSDSRNEGEEGATAGDDEPGERRADHDDELTEITKVAEGGAGRDNGDDSTPAAPLRLDVDEQAERT